MAFSQYLNFTEYSQVRIPPNGKFGSEDAQKYYRHPKVSVYKEARIDLSNKKQR